MEMVVVGASKLEVVTIAVAKKFKEMISKYEGPKDFEKFRGHLLKRLERIETKGDPILVEIINEILVSSTLVPRRRAGNSSLDTEL